MEEGSKQVCRTGDLGLVGRDRVSETPVSRSLTSPARPTSPDPGDRSLKMVRPLYYVNPPSTVLEGNLATWEYFPD